MQNFTPPLHPRLNGAYSSSCRSQASVRDNGISLSGISRRQRHSFPPPASVEDEAESLAKEHGTCSSASASDEDPPARGEKDQTPVLLEVHEHNPERRFVIMSDPSDAPMADAPTKQTAPKTHKPNGTESGGPPEEFPGRRVEPPKNAHQPIVEEARPGLERRTSRQNLPPLDTRAPSQHATEHYSRSTAAYDAGRASRPPGESLLSPEVISSASGTRDKTYRGCGRPPTLENRSPTRQTQAESSDRPQRGMNHRRTRTGSTSRPFDVTFETAKSSKRRSGDWVGGSHRYRDPSPSSRTSRRRQGDAGITPPRTPRDQSRSSYASKDSHTFTGSQNSPIVVQEAYPASTDRDGKARSRSRARTLPVSNGASATSPMPRTSATFHVVNPGQRQSQGGQVPLPYPEDDDPIHVSYGTGNWDTSSSRAARPRPVATMPEPAQSSPVGPRKSAEKGNATSPATTPKKTPDSWQLPPFDPESHRQGTDRPIGSYRRYSETKEQSGSGGLPECPRTAPVMGKMDWLTLPRTNFNICPSCYGSVFAKSEFRTHFQPILRPTDEAIACDFGSSPWYRIAWLLTLKHERQDLRLLYNVVGVASSSRSEVCPGSRRSTRSWLTIDDPYTRRPVPGFAVCYRCAMTAEALLPNLAGLFVSLGSRSEPVREACALHFKPKRRQFVRYFDALETTSDKALSDSQGPDVADLAQELRRLSVGHECREDSPVRDGYWHMMQSLPEMTVCDTCFDEVVRPKVQDGSSVAQDFFTKTQRLPSATCQLYSPRMREIFQRACRRRDREYLEARVLERREIEADIYEKLLKLDRAPRNDAWSEKQVEKLVEEWKRWE